MTDATERPLEDVPEVDGDAPAEDDNITELMLWLGDNLMTAAAIVLLGALVAASLLGVGLPRPAKIVGLSAGVSAVVIGRPTAARVRSMLHTPDWTYFVDLDPRYADSGAIYRLTDDEMQELEVTDGSLNRTAPRLVFGKNLDLDALECAGTWRGTLSDLELARALSNVRECRDRLEDQAKAGFELDAQAFTIVRQAVRDAVRTIRDTFEAGTLPDEGDGLNRAINDALDVHGLDRDTYLSDVVDTDDEDVSIGLNDATLADLVEETNSDVTEVSADD